MRESRIGRAFTVVTLLNLLLMAAVMGGMVFLNLTDPAILTCLLMGFYLTEVLVFILALMHGVQLFLRPEATGMDLFIVFSELLFAFFVTPSVFTVWQSFPNDAFRFFDFFDDALFSRFWMLARLASVYVLLIKGIGNRWMRHPAPEPLTLEELEVTCASTCPPVTHRDGTSPTPEENYE
ncbi:MAG: hypothetical protein PUJ57_06195 [Peptoniphilaceae bacterium]|nr:hypothetical protein [Peptoniphilaceae bacterium]MDY6085722.1 hypothetical protein [Peptoniphilaceae bacterium]